MSPNMNTTIQKPTRDMIWPNSLLKSSTPNLVVTITPSLLLVTLLLSILMMAISQNLLLSLLSASSSMLIPCPSTAILLTSILSGVLVAYLRVSLVSALFMEALICSTNPSPRFSTTKMEKFVELKVKEKRHIANSSLLIHLTSLVLTKSRKSAKLLVALLSWEPQFRTQTQIVLKSLFQLLNSESQGRYVHSLCLSSPQGCC